MKKISITISGHRTSLTLESEFIDALRQIAASQKKSIAGLVQEIDANRARTTNLSSAVRIYILRYLTIK
ncbi:MAG: ribbon-helix-helix domain-containing protein [Alphaproteobacteria bacterium]|nr:ribbon-helix-helix domain-containing protein [Alphaproteobacteria bacterium]MCL2889901.1 ribbon-helix-helix domain-containing protein [Alphaproteobacteria bacterium]